jgi:hypothetical protein
VRKILKISLPFSGRSSLQLFDELVPLGNMNRQGFLEHPDECLRDCCVLVIPLKIRDGLALIIDVPLPALNAAFSFLEVSLQEGSLHGHLTDQRWRWATFFSIVGSATEARSAALWRTTGTTIEQRPRLACVAWDPLPHGPDQQPETPLNVPLEACFCVSNTHRRTAG